MRKTGIISYRVDDPSSGLFHSLTPGQRRRTIMSCHASRAFLYFNAVPIMLLIMLMYPYKICHNMIYEYTLPNYQYIVVKAENLYHQSIDVT